MRGVVIGGIIVIVFFWLPLFYILFH